MITLSLHAPEYENAISPTCPIGSGQEYIVCVTIEDESLQPQENVEILMSVKINGSYIFKNTEALTDENGQVAVQFDVSPDTKGILELNVTTKDEEGLTWKAKEKWNIDIAADYRDCFEN